MTEEVKEEQIDNSKIPFKKRLLMAQNELKAPKNQFNSFGKYHYRNAEDIENAAKKVNLKYDLLLVVTDDVVTVNGNNYIKATCRIIDVHSEEYIETHGFSREEAVKKGMDAMQITGATSSYARKYSLNGMYLIDDVKDADTDEYKKQTDKGKQSPKQPPTHDAAKALIDSCQALAELINAKDGSQQTAKSVYAYFCNQVVGKEIPTSQLNMKQIKDIQTKAAAMFAEYQAK